MAMKTTKELKTIAKDVRRVADAAVNKGKGVLKLAPNWVPRVFCYPGRRLKLHPDDVFAFGLNRGGIDERWFGSTTEAANEGRAPDEGLSHIVAGNSRVLLRDAVDALGAGIVGGDIWKKYRRWPVYSKFFDNLGPLPHHLHQDDTLAALVGREGKPESYYFPPQLNNHGGRFPHTFFGIVPGTTKADIVKCLERWNLGDNGITDISAAYRLKVGTGWFVPPNVLHAPGSLCTYEPQWGSDVFAMFQNLVDHNHVPWSLLVKDVPADRQRDLDFIAGMVDLKANTDPQFYKNHFIEPVPAAGSEADGFVDCWINYGRVKGWQCVTAKRLTVFPRAKVTIKDNGAYSLVAVQGAGRINGQCVRSPDMIRFHDITDDEYFVVHDAARAGVAYENTSSNEPLEILRYFGPEVNPAAPG